MGRYYNGDIKGKFWFGLQSSTAPSRFGGIECEPHYIEYYFDEDQLGSIKKEINWIKKNLGKYKKAFDDFFKENSFYNDESLKEYIKSKKLDTDNIKALLVDYADLGLGEKILKCVEAHGTCCFNAEI